MDIDAVNFDEPDEVSFWTRDIGAISRKPTRKKDESPEFKQKTDEALVGEAKAMKKQLESQLKFLAELQPTLSRIEQVFTDAIRNMERDTFDDVYNIHEMQKEFQKINKALEKHLPKVEKSIVESKTRQEPTKLTFGLENYNQNTRRW